MPKARLNFRFSRAISHDSRRVLERIIDRKSKDELLDMPFDSLVNESMAELSINFQTTLDALSELVKVGFIKWDARGTIQVTEFGLTRYEEE